MQLLSKLCFCALVALPTAALPLAAHADVVTNYTFNGSFLPDPGPVGAPIVSTATGTVVIDSTTGVVDSISATIAPGSGTPTAFDSGATLNQYTSGQSNGDVYYTANSSEDGAGTGVRRCRAPGPPAAIPPPPAALHPPARPPGGAPPPRRV